MDGNATTKHRNVALLAVSSVIAPRITTSEDIDRRLTPALKRLRLPQGLLQRVAGVHERRNWDEGQKFDDAAVSAGHRALSEAGVRPDQVGLLINTSVTRKHLEPSVAVRIHHGLGLPSSAINFDIANACLGFVNGMSLAAGLIDSGQIKYAVVIDGEDADDIQHNTIERLTNSTLGRYAFMSEFASLTLGSGAAAAVLGPCGRAPRGSPHARRRHPRGHRVQRPLRRKRRRHVHRRQSRSSRAVSTSSSPRGRRRSATGTGRTWTATSCTRSPMCTPIRS